jgi:hypothetical protein
MLKFLPRFRQKIDQSSALFLNLVSGSSVHIFSTGKPQSRGRRRRELLPGRSQLNSLDPSPTAAEHPAGRGPRRAGSLAELPRRARAAASWLYGRAPIPHPLGLSPPDSFNCSGRPPKLIPVVRHGSSASSVVHWCACGCSAPSRGPRVVDPAVARPPPRLLWPPVGGGAG